MKVCQTAKEALEGLKSHSRIFVHGCDCTPLHLIDGLMEHMDRLTGLEFLHLHTHGKLPYLNQEYRERVRVTNLFSGSNVRGAMKYDNVDYLPCFLSQIPYIVSDKGPKKVDVALIQVSPPNAQGYCTLGTSVDGTISAMKTAGLVIAQINKQMPTVFGDGYIHVSEIDYAIEIDEKVAGDLDFSLSPEDVKIGEFCASLIEDGSTLQTGIGSLPNAVLAQLKNHKNLGIHSEMWSDGALDLMEAGALNNSQKKIHPGKTVSTFIMGSERVHNFIDHNPTVVQFGCDYTNDPAVIRKNPKVVAINSAVEVDFTGQVCADSVGHRIISGVGGQVDFMRGAALSEGGKAIIALQSRSKKGYSKIVGSLKPGAGVVTTRTHIQYIVTEYGIAYLAGKTIKERVKAMIEIAHPDDREDLERYAREHY